MNLNPYEVLGVDRSATNAEIKRAYKKLSSQHHPDREGGDADRMKELNMAYEVLSTPEKRDRYDRTGQAGGPPPQSPEMVARNEIWKEMIQLVQNVQETGYMPDLVTMIRKAIDKNRSALQDQKRTNKRALKKLEKVRKRIKGGELFEQLFQSQIEHGEALNHNIDEQIEINNLALKMLDGYSMEADEMPQFPFAGRHTMEEIMRITARSQKSV